MSAKDAPLYGIPRPKKSTGKEISGSGSLAFSSQLSSLISAGSTERGRSSGRARSKKEDIFATHNVGTKKRALKDFEPDGTSFAQKHATKGEPLDAASWQRSRRKMEEKARLYAAMKRGDVEDDEGRHMVDFDRKWAEQEDKGNGDDDESEEDISETEEEQVEWTDEFGRSRTTTRSEMAREQRRQQMQEQIQERVRPSAPTNIIFGDTVQAAAFNPDKDAAERMADLAAKRDRSLTPPPQTHFDSRQEIRSKGVGFMQFSQDAEERQKQMANLEADRLETEQRRADRDKRMADRKQEVERRRKEIMERRGKRKADDFLEELGTELEGKRNKPES
ncbi:hypothetical protein MBLNU457_6050t1 [Dothideomycetes sp. NU457]